MMDMTMEEAPTTIYVMPRKSFLPPNQLDVERISFFCPLKL